MAKKSKGKARGALIAIGGAEDKYEEKFILKHFFELSGGKRAHIAILPTASQDERTGMAYHGIFSGLGARAVDVLPLFRREDADDPAAVEILASATGIFLTGGDQNKILAVMHGSESMRAIEQAHERGAIIGGTS